MYRVKKKTKTLSSNRLPSHSSMLSNFLGETTIDSWASLVAQPVKNPPADAGDIKRRGFNPWDGKIPWRRAWRPTLIFLPGKFHGQRSLEAYSLWSCKESDKTEHLCTHYYQFAVYICKFHVCVLSTDTFIHIHMGIYTGQDFFNLYYI